MVVDSGTWVEKTKYLGKQNILLISIKIQFKAHTKKINDDCH